MLNNIQNHLKNELNPLDFVFGETIDKGSFGEVVMATNKNSNKKYAVKIINIRPSKNQPEILKEIEDELIFLNKITSITPRPNAIPNFYGYYVETTLSKIQNYAIIFDFFPLNFKNLISKQNLKDFSKLKIFYQSLLNGLAFLQSLNLCHRDLSPNNLMLDQQNNLKIIDFGLTREFSHLEKPNEQEYNLTIAGKVPYMAPEILDGYINGDQNVNILI